MTTVWIIINNQLNDSLEIQGQIFHSIMQKMALIEKFMNYCFLNQGIQQVHSLMDNTFLENPSLLNRFCNKTEQRQVNRSSKRLLILYNRVAVSFIKIFKALYI